MAKTHRVIKKNGEKYYVIDNVVISRSEYKKARKSLFKNFFNPNAVNFVDLYVSALSGIGLLGALICSCIAVFGEKGATEDIIAGIIIFALLFIGSEIIPFILGRDTICSLFFSSRFSKKDAVGKGNYLLAERLPYPYSSFKEVSQEEQIVYKAFFNNMTEDQIIEFWQNETNLNKLTRNRKNLETSIKDGIKDEQLLKQAKSNVVKIDDELKKIREYQQTIKQKISEVSETVKINGYLEQSEEDLKSIREFDPVELNLAKKERIMQ